MLSAVWTAFNRRQLRVELLLTPDAELGRRPKKTNVNLAMNQFAVDVWSSLLYLFMTTSIAKYVGIYVLFR